MFHNGCCMVNEENEKMEQYDYIGTIQFKQKRQIEQIREAFAHKLSSHAFASLYFWEKHLGLTLYLAEHFFTVKCSMRGENTWFFPCGDGESKKMFIMQHLQETDFSLCYLRDEDKAFLEKYYPKYFEIREEENAYEYIYGRDEYETICGGRFSNMRKQVNRLQKEHKVEAIKLSDENITMAWELLNFGFPKSDASSRHTMPLVAELAKKALLYRKELEIFGILVFVDHIAQSLLLGFPLTKDTVDGCIEYSNTSIHGLSYFGKRAFFLNSDEQYRYMNAEEDLGLPGLRMAKRHMAPICQNRVWNAVRRSI